MGPDAFGWTARLVQPSCSEVRRWRVRLQGRRPVPQGHRPFCFAGGIFGEFVR